MYVLLDTYVKARKKKSIVSLMITPVSSIMWIMQNRTPVISVPCGDLSVFLTAHGRRSSVRVKRQQEDAFVLTLLEPASMVTNGGGLLKIWHAVILRLQIAGCIYNLIDKFDSLQLVVENELKWWVIKVLDLWVCIVTTKAITNRCNAMTGNVGVCIHQRAKCFLKLCLKACGKNYLVVSILKNTFIQSFQKIFHFQNKCTIVKYTLYRWWCTKW